MADPVRCAEAGVPPQQTFLTRPQQVEEMIESARGARVPFAWFTADEEFGQNPGLRGYLEKNRIPYVMAVPKNTAATTATAKTGQLDELAQGYPGMGGSAAPAVSDRKGTGSTTGRSSTPRTPTTST